MDRQIHFKPKCSPLNLFKTTGFILLLLLPLHHALAQNSYQKTGLASYYADKFVGRRTSSGEIFSQKKMTCAHRTLPLGTRLLVTNTENDKSVIVTVNDRGPFVDSRMIDLTKAAAKKLGFLNEGEAEVTIEIISNEEPADSVIVTTDSLSPFYKMEAVKDGLKGYSVKVGSYLSEEKMLELVKELKEKTGNDVFVQTVWHRHHFMYRVFVGHLEDKKAAEALKETIKGFYPECFVVELNPASLNAAKGKSLVEEPNNTH